MIKYKIDNIYNPVIYKITKKSTGKIYIGKTVGVFTDRWYQHLTCNNNDKFHSEFSENCDVTDWLFEIAEIVTDKNNVSEREQFWINKYKSISTGFNSKNADRKTSIEQKRYSSIRMSKDTLSKIKDLTMEINKKVLMKECGLFDKKVSQDLVVKKAIEHYAEYYKSLNEDEDIEVL